MRGARRVVVVATVSAAVLIGGCGDDAPDDRPPETTDASTTTGGPPSSLSSLSELTLPDGAAGFQGVLVDRRGTRDAADDRPLVGIGITVADRSGEVVAQTMSIAGGGWVVEVPGPGRYTVAVVVDDLPEDVVVGRDPVFDVDLDAGQIRPVLFVLGRG